MSNEIQQVESKVPAIVEQARAVIVTSNEGYELAGRFLKEVIRPFKDQILEVCRPVKEAANRAHKEAVAQEQKLLGPVEQAERLVKGQMAQWAAELERRRREEEARLREEARQRAEVERLEQAAAMERAGLREEANALIEQPVEAPPVILADTRPRVEGVAIRSVWKFRVLDKTKLRPEFLIADEKAIGATVRSLKDAAVAVVGPGSIEVYEDKTVAG